MLSAMKNPVATTAATGFLMSINAVLEQAFGACQMTGLRSAFHVESAEKTPKVYFYGVLTNLQFFGNIAVAQTSV